MTRTLPSRPIDRTVRLISFETRDARGREMGAQITRYQIDFVEAPDAQASEQIPPGHYFACHAQATRCKATYGAWQPVRYFPTREAREAYIARYLAAARTRATRTTQRTRPV